MSRGIKPEQLLSEIIRPTLESMGDTYSKPGADILLLATAAQETHCGYWLRQVSGPALGIYQCEPATHNMVMDWAGTTGHRDVLPAYCSSGRMVYDLRYATKIARLLYFSWPDPLPHPSDVDGMWKMYKKCFNSSLGAATELQFKNNWRTYVTPCLAAS